MHQTDPSAEASAKAGADLSPDERRRETCLPEHRRRQVAAIFAAGILRPSTRPGIAPEPTSSDAEDASPQRPESAQKPLDSGRGTSPHVPAG